jgi:hypothetical protein
MVDFFHSDAFKWLALGVYVGINEIIKRSRMSDDRENAFISLKVSEAVSNAEDQCDRRLSSYKEIRRFYVTKFKTYKRDIEEGISDKTLLLECLLKMESKIDTHILENHYVNMQSGELEMYIDYIMSGLKDVILSKFDSLEDFKILELKVMVSTIINTSINIKKRLQK